MEFRKYSAGRISFLIPKGLEIIKESPEFYAKRNKELAQMVVLLNPPNGQAVAERMMAESLPQFPELASVDVRKGPISEPYRGYERVVEERIVSINKFMWYWSVNLYPFDSFINIELSGEGRFEPIESIWQQVINSIQLECD